MVKKFHLKRRKRRKSKERVYNKQEPSPSGEEDSKNIPDKLFLKDLKEKEIKKSKSIISDRKEKIVQDSDVPIEEENNNSDHTGKGKKKLTMRGRPIIGLESVHKLDIRTKDDGSLLEQIDITKKPEYESWSDDVNYIALEIVDEFEYDEILRGSISPRQAPRICGWLKDHYRNYQLLIDNYVLEVAAWYAQNRRKGKIKVVSIISGIPLELYKWSKARLTRVHRLENYPKQPFIDIIFVGEDYLDDAVYWLENSEWIINNEMVRVNLGRYCGDLVAWLDWNVPVILITYLPFRNRGLYRATAEAGKILKMTDDLKLKVIHTYKQKIDVLEQQVDDEKRKAKEWKKMYFDTNKDISLLMRKEQERRRYAEEAKVEIKRFSGTNVLLTCGLIAVAIIAFVGFIT